MAPTLVARNTFEDSGTMILQHVRMLRAHVACACCMRVRVRACARACILRTCAHACMHVRMGGRSQHVRACVSAPARPRVESSAQRASSYSLPLRRDSSICGSRPDRLRRHLGATHRDCSAPCAISSSLRCSSEVVALLVA